MEFHEKPLSPAPAYPQSPVSSPPPMSGPNFQHQPPPMAYHQDQTPPPPMSTASPPLQPQMQQPYNYGQPMSPQPLQPQPQMHQHQQSFPQQQQPPMQQQQSFQQQPPMQYQPGAGSQYQTAVAIPNLGQGSAPVDCPSCGKRGMTRLEFVAGNTTHAWACATFCLTGCLCFIPYLMNSLKDVKHHCGNCGVLLATYHKSGNTEAHMHN